MRKPCSQVLTWEVDGSRDPLHGPIKDDSSDDEDDDRNQERIKTFSDISDLAADLYRIVFPDWTDLDLAIMRDKVWLPRTSNVKSSVRDWAVYAANRRNTPLEDVQAHGHGIRSLHEQQHVYTHDILTKVWPQGSEDGASRAMERVDSRDR
eukprot:1327757-Rhodomonas_salina.2